MRSAHRQLLHVVIAIGALILTTATPTLAWSGPAPTLQASKAPTRYAVTFAVKLLTQGPLSVSSLVGVVVDDGVPF